MAKNAQNIRNAKSANIEMWPILIPPDDHWPQNMWKTKENTMECLRKNRAEWKSTKKHPKNYFLKTFPKNILFFGQNYPKICTKKDFKKNWLVTYTLGWICSGGSVLQWNACLHERKESVISRTITSKTIRQNTWFQSLRRTLEISMMLQKPL